MPGRLAGSLVGLSFGLAFLLANGLGLPAPLPHLVVAVAIGAVVAFVAAVARRRPSLREPNRAARPFGGRYWLVVALEVVVLLGGRALFVRLPGMADAGVVWVTIVVGLHFLPLWRLSGERGFLVIALLLTPLGLAGLALAALGAPGWVVALVAGVGPGLVSVTGAVAGVLGTAPSRTAATGVAA